MIPLRNMRTLRADPQTKTVYLNNAKVGCSTVKSNFWMVLSPETLHTVGDVHNVERSPFVNDLAELDWLEEAKIFTFVRNPYVRIVSAYLNKINRKETAVWTAFARGFGLDPSAHLSFDQFIEVLSGAIPETLNEHFRPQSFNILYPLIRPNYLGSLERMDEMLPKLLTQFTGQPVGPLERRAGHGTRAQEMLSQFLQDSATCARIETLYRNDFGHFGYSEDVTKLQVHGLNDIVSDHSHPTLAAISDFARAKSPDAKMESLSKVKKHCSDTEIPEIAAWLLNAELEAGSGTSKDVMKHIRGNLTGILNGPDYLQRTAAKIAATRGAWPLVKRIAAAAQNPKLRD